MKFLENLLLLVSWLLFVCSFITLLSLITDELFYQTTMCAKLSALLGFKCGAFHDQLYEIIEIMADYNLEIFDFTLEKWNEFKEILVILGFGAVIVARSLAKILRRRRRHTQGSFVDMPGFRPIKNKFPDGM